MIFTPEDRAAKRPEVEREQALCEGRASDQRWHLRKDGARFWSNGFLMPMHDASGKVVGFVKILRDETDTRQAQEALERSRQELVDALEEKERAWKEAETASKAKDHFVAVLSHELRTPLTPVLLVSQMLTQRKDLPPDVPEALEMIANNVQIEARFIDDLLDMTRLARGKLELAREDCRCSRSPQTGDRGFPRGHRGTTAKIGRIFARQATHRYRRPDPPPTGLLEPPQERLQIYSQGRRDSCRVSG